MIDIILYIVLEAAVVGLTIANFLLRIKNKKTINTLVSLENDKQILMEKLAEEMDKTSKASMDSNADFIKFLSVSRDAAFGYIEDVQGALNSFIVKMDKQMQYYHTFGQVMETPHRATLDEISKLYDDLKKVMPQSNI